MELNSKPESGGSSKRESHADRMAIMKALWAKSPVVPVGRLITREMAEIIAQGFALEPITAIRINGVICPVDPPVVLSLNTTEWLCPTCHSAHGTGLSCSPRKAEENLPRNKFYYAPATKRLFVISDTCRETYVDDAGLKPAIGWTPTPIAKPAKS